ncbi:MAG: tetratricopeptide repeat protein [Patescibacteria group bacterium]
MEPTTFGEMPASEQSAAPAALPRPSLFEWLSRTVFALSIFLLPFFVLPLSFPVELGKKALLGVGVLIAVALWVISRLEKGEIHIPRGFLNFSIVLLVLSTILSTLFSGTAAHSFFGVGFEVTTGVTVVIWALVALLSSLYWRTEESLKRLGGALMWGYVIVAAAFVAHLAWPGFLEGVLRSPTDTLLGKWNDFGLFSVFMVLFTMLSLETGVTGSKKLTRVVFALSLLGAVAVNLALGWYLLTFFSLALLVYRISGKFSFTDSDLSRGNIFSAQGIAFVVALLFVLLGGTRADGSQQILGAAITNLENKFGIASIEARPSWPATLEMSRAVASKSLILGVGPNNFAREWRLSKPAVINQSLFWNADFGSGYGFILSSFVTTGLFGVAAWLSLLLGFLFVSIRTLYRLGRSGERFEHALTLFVLGLYLWAVALFYVPDNVLLGLAFVVTGMFIGFLSEMGAIRSLHLSFGGASRARFVGIFASVLIAILSLVGAYVNAKRIYAATLFGEGATKLARESNAEGAYPLVEKASKLSRQDVYFRSLAEITIARFSKVAADTTIPQEQAQAQFTELFRQAYDFADTATKIDAGNSDNWIALGRVYEAVVPAKIPGSYEAAGKAYTTAVATNPRSPFAFFQLARLEYTKGDNVKAKAYIANGLALKPNYAELIFLASQIEAKQGNLPNAIKNAEQAALLAPNDIGVWFQVGVLKYENKDYKGASEALEQAVRINSSYSNARYYLGLSYDRLGLEDRALEQFKQILALNADSAEVKQIIKNLEAGRSALSGEPVPEPTKTTPKR